LTVTLFYVMQMRDLLTAEHLLLSVLFSKPKAILLVKFHLSSVCRVGVRSN